MESYYSGRGTLALIKVIELGQISHRFEIRSLIEKMDKTEDFLRDSAVNHGGISSGVLSTGMYVFFGWNASHTEDPLEHTEKALQWAQYAQKTLAEEISAHPNQPMVLLRISLNTGYFHVEKEVDGKFHNIITDNFPAINQATELCGINGIIFNEKFFRALTQHGVQLQRLHKIKEKSHHQQGPIVFYEYNTIPSDTSLNNAVISCVKSSLNRRETKRWDCERMDLKLKMISSGNIYDIVNISVDGFEVVGKDPKSTGSFVRLQFESGDSEITKELKLNDILVAEAQVRWQKHDGSKYRIGLKFENLTLSDREEIVRILLRQSPKESKVIA